MKKFALCISLLMLCASVMYGQPETDRLARIEQRLLVIDRNEFEMKKNTVLMAVEKFPGLVKEYNLLETKCDFTDLFTKLTQASNPNNEELIGKSYTTFIKDEAANILTVGLPEKAKNGFMNILNKITSVPIIGDIINTNPVASLATRVITSASNFVTQKIEGCAFCQKTLKYAEDVKENNIKEFVNKIQPYVAYYDKILVADRAFSEQLVIFKSMLREKSNTVNLDYSKLLLTYSIKPGLSYTEQVRMNFVLLNNNYYEKLQDSAIIKGYLVAQRYSQYDKDLDLYDEQFSKLFSIYLKTYSDALLSLKAYADSNKLPSAKIDELVSDIDVFVKKYSLTKRGGMDFVRDSTSFERIKVLRII